MLNVPRKRIYDYIMIPEISVKLIAEDNNCCDAEALKLLRIPMVSTFGARIFPETADVGFIDDAIDHGIGLSDGYRFEKGNKLIAK
jgi:hypothetical protein